MFSLQNKQAVITGAGSGIGRAVAELFVAQGAVVHAVDLNAEALSAFEAEAKVGAIKTYACDVTNQKQVNKIFAEIGVIDILVNSAGISHIGNAGNTEEADFERVFNVNVKGVYNCLHEAIPVMQQGGGGVIINLASIAGSIGLSDRFAYSMSKGAVYAMTLSVAKDYIKNGIRCNCVSPARVHTPFVDGFLKKNYPGKEEEMFEKLSKAQPIGRMGTPREIAHLILYLSSDEASFITGSDYPIDGGAIKLNN
ncbi:SDR family oxidoreductase [Segetibacter sp.]|jgi:2-keto-3-deoxy-L-fuconate dehydrogenase|uniref:SDR family NAD(P)-dependent oxidoreductase n=1 Tax=Segetibacter sp. TaxID=2231182 RepID=UPI00261E9261|nr:SDR family oxidoreductase [Segetibacter sp.]MCW3079270.1 family oxidoreductase [Segetibacter sp.]